MPSLSKSKLMACRQCPKRMWLEIKHPELIDQSGSEAVFAIGHQVGAIAQKIYDPAGIGENVDPNLHGWPAGQQRTNELLQAGDRPVFEAILRADGSFALADVMLPDRVADQIRWQIIEVKSSTAVKDYHRDEIALQHHLAERGGISVSRIGIAHIDSSFVYPGDADYRGLLHFEDLTEEARARQSEVAIWMAEAQETASRPTVPEIAIGPQCTAPFTCGFFAHCREGMAVAENATSILPGIRATKLGAWESRGITELRDAPDNEINRIQRRVKRATLLNEVFVESASARAVLAKHSRPFYFLDFETIQFAVPIWKGTRPYQHIPFQFSLHCVEQTGNLRHAEFLDLSGNDPRENLVLSLLRDCGREGTIYVYNAPFEKRILTGLANDFPAHAPALLQLRERIEDLLPLVREYYYHPCQRGSWSLKAVLPGICPEVSYTDLEGVQHGMAAGEAYAEAINTETTPERKAQLRQQLLQYCELDTLATVKTREFFTNS